MKTRSLEELKSLVKGLQRENKKVVWTNGCFDILHAGHVTYLLRAAGLGDALVVGLNSDASVRAVKGPDRPLVPEGERALVLSALECVDHVIVFPEASPLPLIEALRPDVYAKGGDYTIDTVNQEERRLVEAYGGEVALIPGLEGRSTTALIERIAKEGRA